jgi:excisionase family DNA binding protein
VDTISDRIISAPIGEFCVLSGLGRTVVYEMIGDGRLDAIKIGKRRLVLIDSYRRLIERQRAAAPPGRTAPTMLRRGRDTPAVPA